MQKEIIGTCPVCGKKLHATKLTCFSCNTEVTGDFQLSKFNYLTKDELNFVETFVCVQGNIKEMEKEYEVSYPTIKKTLDIIIQKLGHRGVGLSAEREKVDHNEIILKLRNDEITAEEAVKLMRGENK